MSEAATLPLQREIEALLFVAASPLSVAAIAAAVSETGDVAVALAELQASYAGRGFVLVEKSGGWRFAVAPELVHVLATARPVTRPLPRAALATLAIIAWHEPVTCAEISGIRGVAVSVATLALLLATGWIEGTTRDAPGRPLQYATTAAFLAQFGLADRRDLPGLDDLRAAGLLDAAAHNGVTAGDTAGGSDADAAGDDATTG